MTKKPVPTTINQVFRSLADALDKKTPQEREQFKHTWLDGAKRMKETNKRLRNC